LGEIPLAARSHWFFGNTLDAVMGPAPSER
jgi:hypothetical protein